MYAAAIVAAYGTIATYIHVYAGIYAYVFIAFICIGLFLIQPLQHHQKRNSLSLFLVWLLIGMK